ncbi:MAG: ABC transporter permease [Planctomycetota bacterium]|nr:ABC transporter permease [Planctomycetota bacterium]
MMSSSMKANDTTAEATLPLTTNKSSTSPRWTPPIYLLEPLVVPLAAILLAFVLFSIFILLAGANPITSLQLMYRGSFGTSFSIQNSLIRAAPLMLTGLCVALPLQLGMVIIGGEGALVLGGLAAAGIAHTLPESANPWVTTFAMIAAGMLAGGLWIALPGFLKYYRGVNETISSLLLNYIAIAILNEMVEGWMHDPESLNTPSTYAIPDASMIGNIGSSSVHYGFVWGLVLCLVLYVLMNHTVIGFAAKIVGGNMRAARVAGLSVGKLTVGICLLAGAAAGLAGMVEVAAVQGRANANITAPGYGYTGILVAFIARGNPLAIIPVSLLLGGIGASGGLLQRRQHLPDATVLVFQGILFIVILAFETMYGRFAIFRRKEA